MHRLSVNIKVNLYHKYVAFCDDRAVLSYADEILELGNELEDKVKQRSGNPTLTFLMSIADKKPHHAFRAGFLKISRKQITCDFDGRDLDGYRDLLDGLIAPHGARDVKAANQYAEQGPCLSAAILARGGGSKKGLWHNPQLRELYFERPAGDWYFSFGKQQVVWGKADGLKVLDLVNPQSFREVILEDFDQSRIPLWTLNAERSLSDWKGGDWSLQLLWIPDQTYHALPKQDATYAFSSPRLVPHVPAGITAWLEDSERPDRVVQDSDSGLRLTGFLGGWDLSLNYLYQYHNQPVLHQHFIPGPLPVVEITPRYHRTHVLGGTFSRAFGDWVLRGEAGYFNRFFLTNDTADADGVAKSAELSYVLGLDWSGIEDTFISGQLFQSWLPDHRVGFTRPELDTSFTFLARREVWNETLTAEVLWIVNTNDDDGLIRPRVSYALEDNREVWIGLDLFYGNRQGLFGQFDDNDRLLFGVEIGL